MYKLRLVIIFTHISPATLLQISAEMLLLSLAELQKASSPLLHLLHLLYLSANIPPFSIYLYTFILQRSCFLSNLYEMDTKLPNQKRYGLYGYIPYSTPHVGEGLASSRSRGPSSHTHGEIDWSMPTETDSCETRSETLDAREASGSAVEDALVGNDGPHGSNAGGSALPGMSLALNTTINL